MKLSLILLSLIFVGADIEGVGMSKLVLESNAFKDKHDIPKKYTCDGENISPNLSWQNIPNGTKSLVITLDDPDAQQVIGKTFVHWVVLNIDPEMNEIPEGIKFESKVSNLAKEFQNDFHQLKYSGPCPPEGEHRYFFTLFAVDRIIELSPEMNPDFFRNSYNNSSEFFKTYEKNILGYAQLMGKYKRIINK